MKKTLSVLLCAAAAVACSKSSVVETLAPEAIGFDNAFVDNATKAIDPSITTTTLEGFTVYGTTQGNEANAPVVNIFPGIPVSGQVTATDDEGNATAGEWSYDSQFTQYWIADNTYNFAAIVNGTASTDADGMPETIAYDATTQSDLLYAETATTGKATGNAEVAFTFDHLLSKVKFSFKNTSSADSNPGYTYKITNITVSGTGMQANCDVTSYPAYTWAVPTASYTADAPLTFGNIVAAGTEADEAEADVASQATLSSNYERLMIPGDYNAVNIKCRIALLYNGAELDVQNYDRNVSVKLLGGNAYNFVLSASIGEAIEFTVTKVNEWTPNEGQYTENN